jgi:hypothetical protein
VRVISEDDKELVILATRFKAETPIKYANGNTYVKPLEAVKKLSSIMAWHNQPVGIEHPEGYVYKPQDMIAYTSNNQFHEDHIDSHVHILKSNATPDFISQVRKGEWQLSDGFEPFTLTHDPKRDVYLQEDLFPHHLAFTKEPACSPSEGCGFIESLATECKTYTPPKPTVALYDGLCRLNSPCYSKLIAKTNEFFKMSTESDDTCPEGQVKNDQGECVEKKAKSKESLSTETLFTEAQISHMELAEEAAKLKGMKTTQLLRNTPDQLRTIIIEALKNENATLKEEAKKVVTLIPPPTGESAGAPAKPSTLIGQPVGKPAKELNS